ncbi:hypothetical protein AJ79_09778 [Helicocarpus griseus UAMH5409]|uniref:Carrier domain-containing protein n=1 Tax=Helicocarpus griseus UAMH5409 TaxID=1447875 RepID=A0A2B7WHI5_9EURO|nr:hypothetical protein AJ79_09778 [Helicocarpus griseus UAMH5409]
MVKTLATAPPAFKFPQEASYLITGGTGGLGLVICRWMASCGAKNIILLSRRGQQAHGINELSQELLSLGTNLTVLACDVSDIEQVRMVMSRCRTEFPPIKGVIHGAMVLQDRVVERMSLEDFRVPLLPKVAGTRVLIDELASSSLDFIIMLSSSSGIVGNHGQGNYAAGNTFQDALSQYQFPHVRNMICLDFGMIAGAGYVHQHPEINRFYKDHGHHQLPLEKLFSILEYVISPSISGIEIDHRHLIIGSLPDGEKSGYLLRDPKFRHTRKAKLDESHATSQGKGYDLRASLKAATSNQDVYNIIAKEILSKASTLMMVNIQGKDMSKPLTELGLDSLVAVELKTWVSHTFDCTLKASDVLEAKTVVDLAAMVYERSKSPSLTSWKLSAKPETNNMSLENTFTDQIAELPALPLPTLEDTMERYLASARPFAESNSEMQVTSECIRRFLADDGLGQILQSRLLDRQEKSPTANWLHDIHTEALYLEDRRPLTPFTNYFGTYPTRPSSEKYSPAQRAAVISFAVFQFKCMLNAKQIRPETLKGHSVSIDSYHWLFNSCRLPFPLVDRPVKWPSQDHLIAMRNGHLFTVRLNVNGVAVSIAQLTKAFQELIEMADRIAGSNLVSVLTNDRRDAWNENRNILLNASDSNKKTLEFIESADFVICLDKAAPESPEERSHQVWFGSGCNRWNDKPLQL